MKHIAIIGGGFTGLTAAYQLTKAGHKVTIIERNTELGGLASGFFIQGENLEKTYHHIFKTDTDIIDFVKELGIEDKLEWHDSSMSIYYNSKFHKFGGAFELIKFTPLPFLDRIRAGVFLLFLGKYKNWKKFINIKAYEWTKKWAGNNVYKVIWEPLLVGKFSKFYKDVSMAWLWARVFTRANSRPNLLAKEMLGYFNGGFNVITVTLVKYLKENNVEMILGANVQSIISKDNEVTVMIDEKPVTFDSLIATVPSHIFAKLIEGNNVSEEYTKQLNSINYLGAICTIFSTEQDLTEYYWNNINDTTAPFLVFINHTKFIPKQRYGGKNVYYIGAYLPHEHEYFQNGDELYTIWFDYLKKIVPEFDKDKIEDKFMFRLKNAQHIVDTDYVNKIPAYETPVKNVYLANFSQIFPEDRGTNFAVREGKKIAEIINKITI
jgi:protoporphyrinogen oxidase